MRSATFAVLAAALASVCSAAPTAAALPAKFTLSYVNLEKKTVIPASGGIVGLENYGFDLILKRPNRNDPDTLITFTSSAGTVYVPHPEFGNNWLVGTFPVPKYIHQNIALLLPDDAAKPTSRTTGLGMSSTGSLTWDMGDGAGPQSKWTGCDTTEDFTVAWNMANDENGTCVKIDLKVHAV